MGHLEYDDRGVIGWAPTVRHRSCPPSLVLPRPLICQTTSTELDLANAFRDRPPRISGAASCKGSGALGKYQPDIFGLLCDTRGQPGHWSLVDSVYPRVQMCKFRGCGGRRRNQTVA